jgi:hypothetical protein
MGKLPLPLPLPLPPTPVLPTYTAKGIHFELTPIRSPQNVKFADKDYRAEINFVAAIMQKDPAIHVTIEAYVGYDWAGWLLRYPTGRTEKAYSVVGAIMDARARLVRDELVRHGIPEGRIHMTRGEAGMGEEYRKVEFHFDRPK